MKTYKLLLAAVRILIWPAQGIEAQWVRTSEPSIGRVNALALTPNGIGGMNLFAGSPYGGIFLSTNSGTSWTEVNTGLADVYVEALAVSGTSVFTGTYSGGSFGSARCNHRYPERKGAI
jgi:hypothetical protein